MTVETPGPPAVCTRCGKEPRDPGQRWGRRCRTDAKRRERARKRAADEAAGRRKPKRFRLPSFRDALRLIRQGMHLEDMPRSLRPYREGLALLILARSFNPEAAERNAGFILKHPRISARVLVGLWDRAAGLADLKEAETKAEVAASGTR